MDNILVCEDCGKESDPIVPDICAFCLRCPAHCDNDPAYHGSTFEIDPNVWLKELFEYEYCDECGGDAIHHEVCVGPMGWFARCLYEMPEDSEAWHPVIAKFRENN
jgi:hypothetical protein